MNLSYWEYKTWLSDVDFTVVGSGVVGLNCALQLRKNHPYSKIIVLEKGFLPQGASTKNAGFACFGSVSELISDLQSHSEEEVFELVKNRWEGLQLLRQTLGDSNINYQNKKGFELFLSQEEFEKCEDQIAYLNTLLKSLFSKSVYSVSGNLFDFQNIAPNYIANKYEGQIDTGMMMQSLLQKAQSEGIIVVNGIEVHSIENTGNSVHLETTFGGINTKIVCVATNGFAKNLLDVDTKPARAQVLITKPIPNLRIEGTFHLDEGYYYFRNIHNRILFGGGRNLDFKTEETTTFGQTETVQNKLEELLSTVILPNQEFEIDQRWSGIMGVGNQKKAIVQSINDRVFCGVRLGGMGVAIGPLVGKELAKLASA